MTVDIELPEESIISFSMSDARGVTLNKFIDKQTIGKGIHKFTYDLSYLPNGVYFFTHTFNGVSSTKKIIKVN